MESIVTYFGTATAWYSPKETGESFSSRFLLRFQ